MCDECEDLSKFYCDHCGEIDRVLFRAFIMNGNDNILIPGCIMKTNYTNTYTNIIFSLTKTECGVAVIAIDTDLELLKGINYKTISQKAFEYWEEHEIFICPKCEREAIG
jgi:predicted RNA-binding Zn-ribbon protein involved in translation (DUF1610 family)